MIKNVIFDFNGTMFFDEDKHVLSWRYFAKQRFNKEIPDEDFPLHIHGYSNDEIMEYLGGKKLTKEEIYALTCEKENYYQILCEEDTENLHLVQGLVEFLDYLKSNGYNLSICTASMLPNVEWYIKTFSLLKWFEYSAITYDDGSLKRGKPSPEIYLKALNAKNYIPEETIVFEDSLSGIESAFKSGVDSVIAIGPDCRREELLAKEGVKAFITDYTQAIPLFEKLFL